MRLLDRLSTALAPAPDDDRLVAAAPSVRIRAIVRRFWPLARPYRKPWIAGLVLAALLPARAGRLVTNGLAVLALSGLVARGLGLLG